MKHVNLAILCFGLLAQTQTWAVDPLYDDTLENVLHEKGVISKEDWVRIQAAKEQKEEDIRQHMDTEFPIAIGYGRSGFVLESRTGILPRTFNGVFKAAGLIRIRRCLQISVTSTITRKVRLNCVGSA